MKVRKIVVALATAGVLFLSGGVIATTNAAPAQAYPRHGNELVQIDWYRACHQQGGRDPHPGWGAETRCWSYRHHVTFTADAYQYCWRNNGTNAVFAHGRWYCEPR